MDATEPPRIVFEIPALCADGGRADQELRSGLSSTRAPRAGWVLTLKVDGVAPKLRATGDLTDASGAGIGHREFEDATGECSGLARATGVWAGLVLDAEVQRAGAQSPDAPGSVPAAGASDIASGWPPPAVDEPATPEHDWYLHHDRGRDLELGAGVFLMSGLGGGALAGPMIFVMIEAGHGVYLRPSFAFGETVSSIPPSDVRSAMFGAGRFDACLRLPGFYKTHQGMQLDLCAGTDVGMTHTEAAAGTDLPYWAVGPSLDLRGEFGGKLSAVLRATAGVELLRGSYVDNNGAFQDQPWPTVRLEVAFSWAVPLSEGRPDEPRHDGQTASRPWVARDLFEPELPATQRR